MADIKDILVPDIGDFPSVDVIEILVSPGDQVQIEDPLISLESDKAVMEVPSPAVGIIKEIKVSVGDKIAEGGLILTMEVSAEDPAKEKKDEVIAEPTPESEKQKPTPEPPPQTQKKSSQQPPPVTTTVNEEGFRKAHASPAVRKFARELGADLAQITGSGEKGRILKEDVKTWVKGVLTSGVIGGAGLNLAPMPEIDFSKFGAVETQPLSKINKLTGQFLHRNWVTVPHVTQFDEADVTDLEKFRKQLNTEHKDEDVKITILAFLMKALVSALKEFPRFNSSLDISGENLILKNYYHIGVAVDTPNGLVVPVIRDVNTKTLVDLAGELGTISAKARDKGLAPTDMQGGCMTISSLGGVGGTSFTPIVNAPEVAILGVSRSQLKPVYTENEFTPRLMLPLSLSYDHRVIDGANGARFTSFLCKVLADTRRLLL